MELDMKTGVSVELLGKGCFAFSFYYYYYIFFGDTKGSLEGSILSHSPDGVGAPTLDFQLFEVGQKYWPHYNDSLDYNDRVLLFDNEKNYDTASITPKDCNFIFTIKGGWTFWWFGDNASHSYTIWLEFMFWI